MSSHKISSFGSFFCAVILLNKDSLACPPTAKKKKKRQVQGKIQFSLLSHGMFVLREYSALKNYVEIYIHLTLQPLPLF